MRPLVARAALAASPEDLYARLADLDRHWTLAGRWVEPLVLRADGGRVRVRGPLGLRRTVHTLLEERVPPSRVAGRALAGRTEVAIAWTLAPAAAGGTLVELRAEVLRAGALDAALLAAGGRRWLEGRFAGTLDRLR